MGRKASEINFPFAAKPKDLPALAVPSKDRDDEGEGEGSPDKDKDTSKDKDKDKDKAKEEFDWKKHLSKCIRLTRKAATDLGEGCPPTPQPLHHSHYTKSTRHLFGYRGLTVANDL